MPTLLDFRRRIRSVKNTQQITRAMKFVAAARLRRAQEAALAARPYAQELVRVLRSTMARIESPEHPLLARRPEERILVLLLTGERGLAGAACHVGVGAAEREAGGIVVEPDLVPTDHVVAGRAVRGLGGRRGGPGGRRRFREWGPSSHRRNLRHRPRHAA